MQRTAGIFVIAAMALAAALPLFWQPAAAATHPTYQNFAVPLSSYQLSTRDVQFATATEQKTLSLSVNDYAVYRKAYISVDGRNWQNVTLSGQALGGDWLNGSVTGQVPLTALNFSLTQQRLSTQRNFMVVYTCSRLANNQGWDCHSGWQIWQFTATLQSQQTQVVYAVNCGGGAVTASDGTLYSADAYYSGGDTYESGKAITGTLDDALYSSERSGSFSYNIPVQNGQYDVTLKFAEVYWNYAGARVFDAFVEGGQAADDLDLYATAGYAAAYDVTRTVTVSDGSLTVTSSATTDNPKMSAILIKGSQGPAPDECQIASDCSDGNSCTTDACVQATPKYCTHALISGCGGGGTCDGNPGEFLIVDETYTYDESLCGFKYWYIDDMPDAPTNWKTPYDYEDGLIYQRFEVVSQPTNSQGGYTPAQLQFGIWQYNSIGGCCRESMSDGMYVYGPGYVATHSQVPRTWWDAARPEYPEADAPVDFSSPGTFDRLGAPFWSDEDSLVICPAWAGTTTSGWAKRAEYYPMTVRATIVAVPEGGAFSGWDCWLSGGGGGGGSGEFSFTHNFISTDLPTYEVNGIPSLADYDNDGDLDFTVGSDLSPAASDLYWFENDGSPPWAVHAIDSSVGTRSLGSASMDVDGDGWDDLISAKVWYQNGRDGTFTERTYDASMQDYPPHYYHDMALADLDGDGRKDVVALGGYGFYWFGIPANPTLSWTRRTIDSSFTSYNPEIHGSFSPAGIGDLDGDGDNDIWGTVRWYENQNNGLTWVKRSLDYSGTLFTGVLPYGKSTRSVIIDIDDDGDNDIVFSTCDDVDSKAGIFYNSGGGSFSAPQMLPQSAPGRRSSFHSLFVGDLNMDGRLDIMTVDQEDMAQWENDNHWSYYSGEDYIDTVRWYVWTNTGAGWQENVLFDNGLGGHDTIVKDIDQDGDLDIATKVWNLWDGNSNGGRPHADYYENHAIDQTTSGTRLSSNINSGWTQHGGAYWETKGDVIIGRQQDGNGGELISTQTFGDFEVVFDAWPDYSVDTGMYVRTTTDGRGYQITIGYQPGNPMGSVYIAGVGDYRDFSLVDESHITGSPPFFDIDAWSYIWKESDWNQFRIRVEGSPAKITTWINGWKVKEYTDTQARFSNPGRIALQIHDGADDYPWQSGAVARFRNIKVYGI